MTEQETSPNFLKLSHLVESKALSKLRSLHQQIDSTLVTDSDREQLGENLASLILSMAIHFANSSHISLERALNWMKVDSSHAQRVAELLLQSGLFKNEPGLDALSFSSPRIQEYFTKISTNESLELRAEDRPDKPRIFWRIPGQHSLIGPIDPDDLPSIYRMGEMELSPDFAENVENNPSPSLEALKSNWVTQPSEFDKARLNKLYGIYGSPELPNTDEVGEIQGGSFLYAPNPPESLAAIKENAEVLRNLEAISGSSFNKKRVVEVSYFKTPHGESRHIAAGVRQILAREYRPTPQQTKKIQAVLEGTSNNNDVANPRKLDWIFISFIVPINKKSKRVAKHVGMEYAGTIQYMHEDDEGKKEEKIVEVWVLNRKLLQEKIIQDMLGKPD